MSRFVMFVTAALLLLGISVSQAAIECDFESPVYTSGTSFYGVDGWSTFSTAAPISSRVTPDPLVSGYTTVLNGSQSAVFYAPSNPLSKGFTSASDIGDQTDISMKLLIDTGGFIFMPSHNLPAGASTMGLFMTEGGFKVYSASLGDWTLVPGMTYSEDVEYVVGFDIDFIADTFSVYIENADGTGKVTSSAYALGIDIDPASSKASGGFFLYSAGAAVIDDIQTLSIPEPATMILLGCGLLGLLRRRNNG